MGSLIIVMTTVGENYLYQKLFNRQALAEPVEADHLVAKDAPKDPWWREIPPRQDARTNRNCGGSRLPCWNRSCGLDGYGALN